MPQGNYTIIFFLATIWSIFWKGIALWRASQNEQKIWFAFILVLNTFGVLEIIYLFKFAKKKLTLAEMKSWTNSLSSKNKSK